MKAGNTALARKKSECMKLHPSQDTARDKSKERRLGASQPCRKQMICNQRHGGQKLPFEKAHLSTSPPHSQPHYTNQESYLGEKETDCFLNWSSFQY